MRPFFGQNETNFFFVSLGGFKGPLTLLIYFFFLGGGLSFLFSSLFLCFCYFFVFFSWLEQHLAIQLQCFSLGNPFFLFWFPVFFLFQIPCPYLCSWPDLKCCCFLQHQCFSSERMQVTKHECLVKNGGCNITFFFESLVFCKM